MSCLPFCGRKAAQQTKDDSPVRAGPPAARQAPLAAAHAEKQQPASLRQSSQSTATAGSLPSAQPSPPAAQGQLMPGRPAAIGSRDIAVPVGQKTGVPRPLQEPSPLDFKVTEINPEDLVCGFSEAELVGRGATCEVFRGVWFGNKVAVKKFPPHLFESLGPKLLRIFMSEVAVLESLRHPNVISYFGCHPRRPYFIVMGYANGGTLHSLLHRKKPSADRTRHANTASLGSGQGSVPETPNPPRQRGPPAAPGAPPGRVLAPIEEVSGVKAGQLLAGGTGAPNGPDLPDDPPAHPPQRAPSGTLTPPDGPAQSLGQAGELPWAERLRLLVQTSSGLQYLHSESGQGKNKRPTIHGDLKAGNVLLQWEGGERVAKLTDFGFARIKGDGQSSLLHSVMGWTVRWTAPEMLEFLGRRALVEQSRAAAASGGAGDQQANELSGVRLATLKAADVYAFGVLMWEVAAQELPYPDLNDRLVLSFVVHHNGRPTTPVFTDRKGRTVQRAAWACTLPADAPPGFQALMERCWDDDPRARPAFTEVTRELQALYESCRATSGAPSGITSPPMAHTPPREQPAAARGGARGGELYSLGDVADAAVDSLVGGVDANSQLVHPHQHAPRLPAPQQQQTSGPARAPRLPAGTTGQGQARANRV